MKKIIFAAMLVMALSVPSFNTFADNNQTKTELSKDDIKSIEKDTKSRCKELRKAGWEPLASAATMEYSMKKYRIYVESNGDDVIAITGIALGQNQKIGRESAVHSGIASYANRAAAQITGKLKSVMSTDAQNMSQDEIDKFGAAYEQAVNEKLPAFVKEHFVLVRQDKSGLKEFNVFMTINEKAAREARVEAARQAQELTQLQTLSEMVDEFIGEPVDGE